jgi:V/A-type H+-transporting ATPase subunit K
MTEFFSQFGGLALAMSGAALAVILGGIGSIIGVGVTGQAGAGVTTEKPDAFGKILLLEALPGTQGIYGFLGAFMIMLQLGILGGAPVQIGMTTGWAFFFAALPVGFTCLFSGMYQGKVSSAGLNVVAKDPANAGKAVILSAMVETYAVLGLLISIFLILGIQVVAV